MSRARKSGPTPGTVPGDITSIGGLAGVEPHEIYSDGPDGEVLVDYIPGIETELTLSHFPFVFGVRAAPSPDGPQLVELHIDSPSHDVPITADQLRSLAKFLDRMAYAATDFVDPSTDAFHRPEKPLPKRPGVKGHGRDHYERVAEVAREAHQRRRAGVSARKAIAAKWHVSEHTADKWIARARALKLLKPGELGGRARKAEGK